MQFNSVEFIFCFFPVFLLVYYGIRPELRSAATVLGSFVFYSLACGGNYWWIAVLAAVVLLSYAAAVSLRQSRKAILLGVYLGGLGGLLVFFKLYAGGRYLPVGMSFYLFQAAACLIDVYRGRIEPDRNLLQFVEQLVLFPKLLSGPLVAPAELQRQNRENTPDYAGFHQGLQELILGLGLKVLLANRIGGLWSQAGTVGYGSVTTAFAWMALLAYAMQLYFDFWGYSLMAIGIGRMLGYALPANFMNPYAARSVSEFWRRWHVTLGAWFREYVYIPLGGNRKGTVRTIGNLAVVWLLTGLWHGVGGNYLLWAGFLFLMIVNERLWLGKLLQKTKFLCHVYTVFVMLLSWLPFAMGNMTDVTAFLGRLFCFSGVAINPNDYILWGGDYGFLLLAGILFMTPVPERLWNKVRRHPVSDGVLLVLFWIVVYFIATAAQDPFMYFQY